MEIPNSRSSLFCSVLEQSLVRISWRIAQSVQPQFFIRRTVFRSFCDRLGGAPPHSCSLFIGFLHLVIVLVGGKQHIV